MDLQTRNTLTAALTVFTLAGSFSALAQSRCPVFTTKHLDKQDQSGNRFATFPGGFVMLANELSTDTDGASTAYHPDNIGSSHLCDGMNVYRDDQCPVDYKGCYAAVRSARAVHWDPLTSPAFCVYAFVANGREKSKSGKVIWGGGHSSEALPVQKAGDLAPGFFVSVTASPVPSRTGRGVEYADADRLPYLVMPTSLTRRNGPTGYRDTGAIVRLSDDHAVYALVADENDSPAEVSVAAAQLIHDPKLTEASPVTEPELRGQTKPPRYPYDWSEANGRVSVITSKEGPYLVFALGAKYGKALNYDPDPTKLKKLGSDAFSSFGGVGSLTACARQFFGR